MKVLCCFVETRNKEKMETTIFAISGMSCMSCVQKIESTLRQNQSFSSVSVSRSPDQIKLIAETPVSAKHVNELLLPLKRYLVSEPTNQASLRELFPLFLILSYILITVLIIESAKSQWLFESVMSHYMAGFFIVFSFFKFLNLRGVADAFETYDPIAKRFYKYGYVYAIFELFAGLAYLLIPNSIPLNVSVLAVLSISSLGVFSALKTKRRIQCACLGTIFNLPMTKVTLVENAMMMSMAILSIGMNLLN